jgi:hypothetical protein
MCRSRSIIRKVGSEHFVCSEHLASFVCVLFVFVGTHYTLELGLYDSCGVYRVSW